MIKVFESLQDMDGIGEEWLVDSNGDVRAVFIDGNIRCEIIQLFSNVENTAVAI